MKAKKRNRFWRLHSLLGISLGLPLFVIFLAGTLALFEPESLNWTNANFDDSAAKQGALNGVVSNLLEKHPQTDELSVVLATPERPVTDIYLEEAHHPTHYWIDPQSGEATLATDHDADLFHFFVDLHYFEFLPYGIQLSGLIAALFFALILTGAVYQWRSMKQDIHPRNLSLQRKSRWKKVHRFTSLLTLPFQVIYSVTGASLALGLFLAAPAVWVFFDGDQAGLNEVLFPEHMVQAEPLSERPSFPVDEARAKATSLWGESVEPLIIHIEHTEATEEAAASHTLMVQGKQKGLHFVGNSVVTLDESLNVLHSQSPTSHLGPMMIEGLVNVHFAAFNGFFIKIIFAFFGLIVSLSIGAGVYIFLQRLLQGEEDQGRKTRFLVVTTNWVLGGLPLAVALALHAAQLLPDWPVKVFWVVTGLSLALTVFCRRALLYLSLLAAGAFVLLPLSFFMGQGQSSLQMGDAHGWMVSFFNIFFVVMGLSLALLVRQIGRRTESAE
ncbi:PepSY-associated TM helix domain-containing protein [Roseibacillus persicicus]|uniref:PepSY-associated TM helix domain-containing protein n=1 Tax=Roseibacillus persicicus TaxID=454148 RepID=UPI00398B0E38